MAKYAPGHEPEKLKKYLDALLDELDETYPDGVVDRALWNHSRWDAMAGWLVEELGYENGKAFLEAYDFTVEPRRRRKTEPVKKHRTGKNRFTAMNAFLLLLGIAIFAFGLLRLLEGAFGVSFF